MSRLTTTLGALAATAALAFPGAASAADTHEPNNGIQEAFGPVPANTAIAADFGSTSDIDWYLVRVSGQGTLNVNVNNLADATGCRVYAELLDENGAELTQIDPADGITAKISYSTSGATSYYMRASAASYCSSAGNAYRISVGGPVADGPGVGTPTPTPNQSPTAASAYGPLTAGTLYGANRDVEGEEDWFMFYTSGPGAFDIAVTNSGDASGCSMYAKLHDETGTEMSSLQVGDNTIGHLRYTAPRAQKFLVRFVQPSYCSGSNAYRLRVDGPLSSTPAPVLDTDGDGIPDASDKCRDKAGVGDGCQTPKTTPTPTVTPSTPVTPVSPVNPVKPATKACAKGKGLVASLSAQIKNSAKQLATTKNAAKKRGVSKARRRALNRKIATLSSSLRALRTSLANAKALVDRSC